MLPKPQSAASTTTPALKRSRAPPLQSQSPFMQEKLQQLLMILVEGARESWTYAIFWQPSYHYSGASLLSWGDGYYKGGENKGKGKASKTTSPAEQDHRKKVLLELHTLIFGPPASADDLYEDVTDTEWFFLVSMTQTFVNGGGLPGQAFFNSSPIWITGPDRLAELSCERARQGQMFGLQTLVCIPSSNGVVELASTEVFFPNPDLMNKARDLFNFNKPEWIAMGYLADYINPILTHDLPVDEPPALQPLRKDRRLCERADSKTHNHENNNLSKQSRDKEKISDSKCPWSLLSESSDKSTDSTLSYSHDYSGPS